MTDHSGFKALTKIDMNSKAIEALPAPTLDTEPVRFGDTVTKRFWIPATSFLIIDSTASFSGRGQSDYYQIVTLDFDPDTAEAGRSGFFIPKDWKKGTAITVRVMFYADAIVGAATIYMGYYTLKNETADPTVAPGANKVSTLTVPATAFEIKVSSLGTFTPADADADSFFAISIRRRADSVNDTLLVDFRFIAIYLEYTAEVNK